MRRLTFGLGDSDRVDPRMRGVRGMTRCAPGGSIVRVCRSSPADPAEEGGRGAVRNLHNTTIAALLASLAV
jgi:hypothetical protein